MFLQGSIGNEHFAKVHSIINIHRVLYTDLAFFIKVDHCVLTPFLC